MKSPEISLRLESKGSILVVDDTRIFRQMLSAVLAKEGYRVRTAGSGELALAAVAVELPDLILLDVNMPGIDGIAVFRRLREQEIYRDIPVIFISAITEVIPRLAGLELGAMDFITKPFNTDELLARVNTHVTLSQSRRQLVWQAEELRAANEDLAREINERRQAAEELLASEQRFRALFEQAAVGVALLETATGRFVDINQRYCDFLGYSPEEMLNSTFQRVTHPDDVQANIDGNARLMAGAIRDFSIDKRYVRKDGAVVWGNLTASPMWAAGEIPDTYHHIAVVQDITERKKLEATTLFLAKSKWLGAGEDYFRALARHLAGNMEMEFICIDRLLGDNLSAATVAMYFQGKFEDNVTYALKDTPCGEVLDRGVCCFPKDVRLLFPKDSVLQEMKAESYLGTTLWDSAGRPFGLIAAIGLKPLADPGPAASILKLVAGPAARELERRDAENVIRRANEQLRAANDEKARYISIIAHDLRNPLAVFLGYTEMLVRHLDTMTLAELKQIAGQMYDSVVGIDRLLTNLLEWSTMQLGRIAYDPQPGQLAGLVAQACEHCNIMAGKKGITVVRQVPEEIIVLADWPMIISVVRNFVSNAIKFTPAGGTVTVTAASAGGTVTVSIADTGIGMSRVMVDELFRLDRRAKRNGTAGEPSTGLGLNICDGFIKQHGGSIMVESAEGQGTTMRFTLPAAPPAE